MIAKILIKLSSKSALHIFLLQYGLALAACAIVGVTSHASQLMMSNSMVVSQIKRSNGSSCSPSLSEEKCQKTKNEALRNLRSIELINYINSTSSFPDLFWIDPISEKKSHHDLIEYLKIINGDQNQSLKEAEIIGNNNIDTMHKNMLILITPFGIILWLVAFSLSK